MSKNHDKRNVLETEVEVVNIDGTEVEKSEVETTEVPKNPWYKKVWNNRKKIGIGLGIAGAAIGGAMIKSMFDRCSDDEDFEEEDDSDNSDETEEDYSFGGHLDDESEPKSTDSTEE